MVEHRCDPDLTPTGGGPLTYTRVLRLLLADLDDGVDLEEAVTLLMLEMANCPLCLSTTLIGMAGAACGIIRLHDNQAGIIADLDLQLTEALDKL